METVYVVFCNTRGCWECGNDFSHVVAVAKDKETAETIGKQHGADKKAHYKHHHWTEVQPMTIATL